MLSIIDKYDSEDAWPLCGHVGWYLSGIVIDVCQK
jgi:hypothetical protein